MEVACVRFLRGSEGATGRQAYLWAVVGVLGLAFAAIGYGLLTRDDGSGSPKRSGADHETPANSTPSATSTRANATAPNPASSASVQANETVTLTVVPTSTAAAQGQQNPSTGGSPATATPRPPAPVPPTAEATQVPSATRAFCNTTSSSSPPNSIFGLLTIGGQPGPAGTIVTITFDGAVGPSVTTSAAGGYRVDYPSGGDDCANRSGAALAIVVSGQSFAAGTLGGTPATRLDVTVP
jgi:hypothetical protein